MEAKLGLPPNEMISIFNGMYLDVWEKTRDKVNWESAAISRQMAEGKDVDVSELLLRVLEVVVTAARDAAILTMHYNNEQIYQDLRNAGIELPLREAMAGEVDE